MRNVVILYHLFCNIGKGFGAFPPRLNQRVQAGYPCAFLMDT